jgi:hypothetical protein
MTPRPQEEGMALVTVLLLVAVAAAALAIMMSGEDAALRRATLMADAARARAIASAGELSAIVALRRDGDLTADDSTEAWARIADRGSPIIGGRFQLGIADAQGKLNLNMLARGDALTRQRLAALAIALKLPPNTPDHIAAFITITGPLSDLSQLAAAGLSPSDIARRRHRRHGPAPVTDSIDQCECRARSVARDPARQPPCRADADRAPRACRKTDSRRLRAGTCIAASRRRLWLQPVLGQDPRDDRRRQSATDQPAPAPRNTGGGKRGRRYRPLAWDYRAGAGAIASRLMQRRRLVASAPLPPDGIHLKLAFGAERP